MDPEERNKIVGNLKKQIRKNNWNYLCRHPEIRAVVRVVLNGIMRDQPENVYDYTANMFDCDNLTNVTTEINALMPRISSLSHEKGFTDYDNEAFFTEGSQCSDAESILKYSGFCKEGEEHSSEEEPEWKIDFSDVGEK